MIAITDAQVFDRVHKQPAFRSMTTACLWLVLAGPGLAQSAPEASRDLSLVTHNAVVIAAPPERIWPSIVEPDAWKAGAQLVPVEGAEHRFRAVMPDEPDIALFHVTNVEFDAPHRRTIRLNALDGALIGHASWNSRRSKAVPESPTPSTANRQRQPISHPSTGKLMCRPTAPGSRKN